ncbi:FecR domain-containing protein [Lacibacterium aquatile]|uniref:FecR domain-containing protein n=1 Tax=Lacibacterium aquatile TaxID=1168082 RepID=A0ABW5DL32_9PROT
MSGHLPAVPYTDIAQLAQADAQAIGRIDTVAGQGTITRVDGTVVQASKGTPVFQGDLVETPKGGKVGVVFVDNTTFALGENGQMRMDELVYNPTSKQGTLGLSMLKGAFVLVTGEIAPSSTDAMTIRTPVGTIGIRGTKIAGGIDAENGLVLSLLPDPVGRPAAVVVSNAAGTQFITEANTGLQIQSYNSAPTAPQPMGNLPGALNDVLAQVLAFVDGIVGNQIVQALQQVADAQAAERAAAVRDTTSQAADGAATPPPTEGQAGTTKIVAVDALDIKLIDPLATSPDLSDRDFHVPAPTVRSHSQTTTEPPVRDLGESTVPPHEPPPPDSVPTLKGAYVVGTDLDELLIGTEGNDALYGKGGNDTILGISGIDLIDGGNGNDIIQVGDLGTDTFSMPVFTSLADEPGMTIIGGAGSDTLMGTLSPADGEGSVQITASLDSIEHVMLDLSKMLSTEGGAEQSILLNGGFLAGSPEIILFSATSDIAQLNISASGYEGSSALKLNAASLFVDMNIVGTENNDVIASGSGDDYILGGNGADKLIGGLGHDSLNGGSGNDTLYAGSGHNQLSGGDGADRFVVGNTSNDFVYLGVSSEAGDTIDNFISGGSAFWFTDGDIGSWAISAFATSTMVGAYDGSAGSSTMPGVVFWDNGSGGGKLYYDANGNGAGLDGGYVIATIEQGSVQASDLHVGTPLAI